MAADRRVSFTLPAEQYAALTTRAERDGVTVDEYCKARISQALLVYVSSQPASRAPLDRTKVEPRWKKEKAK